MANADEIFIQQDLNVALVIFTPYADIKLNWSHFKYAEITFDGSEMDYGEKFHNFLAVHSFM